MIRYEGGKLARNGADVSFSGKCLVLKMKNFGWKKYLRTIEFKGLGNFIYIAENEKGKIEQIKRYIYRDGEPSCNRLIPENQVVLVVLCPLREKVLLAERRVSRLPRGRSPRGGKLGRYILK